GGSGPSPRCARSWPRRGSPDPPSTGRRTTGRAEATTSSSPPSTPSSVRRSWPTSSRSARPTGGREPPAPPPRRLATPNPVRRGGYFLRSPMPPVLAGPDVLPPLHETLAAALARVEERFAGQL